MTAQLRIRKLHRFHIIIYLYNSYHTIPTLYNHLNKSTIKKFDIAFMLPK